MARFFWGFAVGILLVVAGLALVVSLGGINMAATEGLGRRSQCGRPRAARQQPVCQRSGGH